MSTRIMAVCWPLQIPASAKAVLISLADQANDDGVCWPSVGTIAERTCLAERTVQTAITWLEQVGYVRREMKSGRSTRYTLTCAADAPPQQMHPRSRCTHGGAADAGGGAAAAPKPTKNPKKNQKSTGASLPEWIDADVWEQWAEHRKAIRKPLTPQAVKLQLERLAELRKDGQDVAKVIRTAIERGWTGLFALQDEGLKPTRGGTVTVLQTAATPDEAILRRISAANGNESVQRLPDGRLKCGVRYYRPNGVEELAI